MGIYGLYMGVYMGGRWGFSSLPIATVGHWDGIQIHDYPVCEGAGEIKRCCYWNHQEWNMSLGNCRRPTMRLSLLVPQGLYGIQPRCFDGGIHAKEQADAHGDTDSKHDRPERNG